MAEPYTTIGNPGTAAAIAAVIAIASSSSAASNVAMDPRIWRHLPQSLIDRVLVFLPPPAFFRARAVCKRWYALLFSDSFLELHLRVAPRFFYFVFFLLPPAKATAGSSSSSLSSTAAISTTATITTTTTSAKHPPTPALLLDPVSNSWHRICLGAIIPPGFSPAASSNGILCFISDDAGSKTLVLCNLLSKLASHLPPTPTPRLCPTVGLTVGPSSISAVVAGDDMISPFAVKNLSAECFHADGATGFYSPWTTVSALPRLCSFEPGRMTYAAGRFYGMSCGPYGVLAYDIGTNTWEKIQPPMRRFLRSPSIVECGGGAEGAYGRVVLIAAVEKSKLSVPRSVRMWALQPCGRAWAEIERMPQEVYVQFSEVEGGRGFESVGHGNVVAITIKGSCDVLLFDFELKEWRWAPPCRFIPGGGSGGGLRGFAYEPHLATPCIGLLDTSSTIPFQGFTG